MKIFLLRHFESEKNVADRLSGTDKEKLTFQGRKECEEFSDLLKSLCSENKLSILKLYSANSERARETSEIIGSALEIKNVYYYSNLKSTNAGNISGKSLEEIKVQDPFFATCYGLYKKGLLDSYFLDKNWKDDKKESKKKFEKRVISCFEKIVAENDKDDTIFIVLHRASITAILIYIARKMGIYPTDFYGNIESSTGGLSCVTYDNNEWDIMFINEVQRNAKKCIQYCLSQGSTEHIL